MTPSTPPMLAKYRERHRINAVRDWDEDVSRFVERCETDGIRVYRGRNDRWVHDVSVIRYMAAIERGEHR